METLFVYGTLQDPDVQKRVFGRVTVGQPDSLSGYRKDAIQIGETIYPIAVQDEAGTITGRVLMVSAEELVQMDAYEGDDYRRVRVRLKSGREAWVYCA